MKHLMAVILAAGEGKRMKSKNSKVSHRICGKSLIQWVYQAADRADVDESIVIVGHREDQVKECLGDSVKYAMQKKQLGTGHAVMQAEEFLKGREGTVLVLYGDTPLITGGTLKSVISEHDKSGNAVTLITANLEDPTGYGRIIRDEKGNITRIVEQKDASEAEKAIKEINPGMYCFNIKDLLEALKELNNNNSQGEYYLTDTIGILLGKGRKAGSVKISDSDEILGINDRLQLAEAAAILRKRINERLMKAGVTIIDPSSAYIDEEAVIGTDTVIYPGTIIEGGTCVGEGCVIGPNSRIVSSGIGNNVEIVNSIVMNSSIGDDTHIGPFAYIRPESKIGSEVKIGDFVEIKKSIIGDKTKISHLTYVGDAEVGKNVNLGCGVVFVNYDGKKKNKTIVGDNCFIGCNVNLISPVTVKDNAYVAAGSTITEEVPEGSLAIARCRQTVKEGWVKKKDMDRE